MAVLGRTNEDYEMVDPGHYTFEWHKGGDGNNGEPYESDNIYFRTHDEQGKPVPEGSKNRKTRWQMVVDFYVVDNEDWEGEFVRMWFNPTMGTVQYPSTMRPFVAAALGLKADEIDDEAEYDTDDCVGRRLQGMVVHKAKKAGGVKAVVEAPVPLKRASSGRRRAQAAPPPPLIDIEDVPFAEEEFDEAV